LAGRRKPLYNCNDLEHLLDMGKVVYARVGPAAFQYILLRCGSKEAVLADFLGTTKSFITTSIADKCDSAMELAEY
jgi:hypothetical protein